MADKTRCQNCTSDKPREVEENVVFSAASYERHEARHERREKRLVVALVVALIMVFLSNAIWLYAWCQYDYESYEINADGDSNANYIGEDGNIYNGGFNQSEETDEKK